MASDYETLLTQSSRLFEEAGPLRSLQQELALNFYPERADFTGALPLGTDYAAHLTTSYPLGTRRDLANIFTTMLRPDERIWAKMSTRNYADLPEDGKRWLETGTYILRNALYDNDSGFARATSQADDDIAVFGQSVLSCEMNWRKKALLFRCWHQRDVVWRETAEGTVGRVDRKWCPTISDLNVIFKGKISDKLKKHLSKDPYKKIEVRHIFVPVDDYQDAKGLYKKKDVKYISIFYDCENKFVMEEVPYKHRYYIVPRWKTISGSQYAYSPASMSALPDARTLQAATLTLLEAGEKAVDPPMLAYADVLRSDVDLASGGITMIEGDYDERTGRPLQAVFDSRHSNIPIGADIIAGIRSDIHAMHFLNKIGLPPMGSGMSTLEVSQRVAEYIRGALPLFQPLEPEYNGQLCGVAVEVMMANGFFGPKDMIPDSLLGRDIEFTFENPLREAADRAKGNMLLESTAVLTNLAAFDPTVAHILDAHEAARDTIDGQGAPRKWFKTREEVEEKSAADAEAAAMADIISTVGAGAEAAKTLGEAGQALDQTTE